MANGEGTHEWRLKQLEDADTDTRMTRIETELVELRKVPEKLATINRWLAGIAAGLIIALGLLVMDLAIGYHPNPPAPRHGVQYQP